MKTLKFFQLVLPSQGLYYLALHKRLTNKEGREYRRFWHYNQNRMDKLRPMMLRRRQPTDDVYFALGAFQKKHIETTLPSGETKKLKRVQQNFKCIGSLFMDCDIGKKGKDGTLISHASRKEAVQQIMIMCRRGGIPEPSVYVNSGNGLHVYWALEEDIDLDLFRDLANRLVAAAVQHGVLCDASVTIDCCRILRMPNTWNNKVPDDPKKVEVIDALGTHDVIPVDDMIDALEDYTPEIVRTDAGLVTALQGMQASSLLKGMVVVEDENAKLRHGPHDTRQASMAKIVKECPLMAEMLANGGAGHSGTAWYNMMNVAAFTTDGHEWVHKLAGGHEEYNEMETTNRWNKALEVKFTNPQVAPTLCVRFHQQESCKAICEACPYWKDKKDDGKGNQVPKIGSPITLGRDKIDRHQEDHGLPFPYLRNEHGHLCKIIPTADDEPTKTQVIVPYPTLDPFGITPHNSTGERWRVGLPISDHHGERTLQILASAMPTDFQKEALAQNVPLQVNQIKALQEFAVSFLQGIMNNRGPMHTLRQAEERAGWIKNAEAEERSFRIGEVVITSQGNIIEGEPVKPNSLLDHMRPRGDEQPWLDAFDLICKQPDMELLMATTFAAPLMHRLSEAEGLVLSFVSDGGTGKSSAMRTAAAVWGNPKKLARSNRDTANFVEGFMGTMAHLPVYWDDLPLRPDDETIPDLVFSIGQGTGKGRATQDGGLRHVSDWCTMMVCSSNTSLLLSMAARKGAEDAAQARIFEIETPQGVHTTAGSQSVFQKLDTNYGHIGPRYMEWVINNLPHLQSQYGKLLNLFLQNQTGAERFRAQTVALLLLGAYAATASGVATFNMQQLRHTVRTHLGANRLRHTTHRTETTSAEARLGQFTAAMARHTVELADFSEIDAQHVVGAAPSSANSVLGNTSNVPNPGMVIAVVQRRRAFTKNSFIRYASATGFNGQAALDELEQKGVIQKYPNAVDLFAKTPYENRAVTAYEVL